MIDRGGTRGAGAGAWSGESRLAEELRDARERAEAAERDLQAVSARALRLEAALDRAVRDHQHRIDRRRYQLVDRAAALTAPVRRALRRALGMADFGGEQAGTGETGSPLIPAPVRSQRNVDLMLVTLGLPDAELEPLASRMARHCATSTVRPLFVVDSDAFSVFRKRRFQFEYVPPRDDWVALGRNGTYDDFVRRRLQAIVEAHRPALVIAAGTSLDPIVAAVAGDHTAGEGDEQGQGEVPARGGGTGP